MRRLRLFYKAYKTVPKYVHNLIPSIRTSARQPNTLISFYCRAEYFQNSFLSTDSHKRMEQTWYISLSYISFSTALLSCIKFSEKKKYNIHDQVGVELLTRLRLGLSHLREHKFRQTIEDTLNPFSYCSIEVKTTFFLHCQFSKAIREILTYDLMKIYRPFPPLNQNKLVSMLPYGSDIFKNKTNRKIVICTLKFYLRVSQIW